MVWFTFTKDFDFRPSGEHRVTVSYKAGMTTQVTRECAARAAALDAGKKASRPKSDRTENDDAETSGA
jgi:hypothetical protein